MFLTQFMPLVSFNNPWKHQKTRVFCFQEVSKETSGMKWVNFSKELLIIGENKWHQTLIREQKSISIQTSRNLGRVHNFLVINLWKKRLISEIYGHSIPSLKSQKKSAFLMFTRPVSMVSAAHPGFKPQILEHLFRRTVPLAVSDPCSSLCIINFSWYWLYSVI